MRLVLALVAILIAVVLALQNAPAVIIRLFFWQVEAPLAVVIAVSFAAGIAISLLASMPQLRRMRARERQLLAKVSDARASSEGTSVVTHRSDEERPLRVNEHEG